MPIPKSPLPFLAASALALAACTNSPNTSPGAAARPASAAPRDPAHTLLRLGDALRAQGDPEGALDLYRAALARNPRDATALARVGEASLAAGRPQQAEQAFRAAVSLDGNAGNRRGLALALLLQHRAAEALPVLEEVVAGTADDPSVLRALGVAFDLLGRQAEAQATYRRGLVLAPADPDLRGNLALSLAVAGDLPAALTEMEAALNAPVPSPWQETNAVLLLGLAGQGGAARGRGERVLGAEPTSVLLARAEAARVAPDAAARARALGLVSAPALEPRPGEALAGPAAAFPATGSSLLRVPRATPSPPRPPED